MILAAIDIGSNAARLLITKVIDDDGAPKFTKLNLIRVPLRLGFDVFNDGKISDPKKEMFLETMLGFHHFLKAYRVDALKACATSAMRDAGNAEAILKEIEAQTNILVEVISGDVEAGIVFENHIAEQLNKDHSYLYIDVGGGSTELSFFSNGILVYKNSFNIGTIRLLTANVLEEQWKEMKETIKAVTKGHKKVIAIGSGGNINKLFSMSKKKDGKPLSLELLRDYYKELNAVSLAERINKYKLNEDRADVIIPALSIYINVMRWANAEEIFVPKIGLADGLIQHLYSSIQNNSLKN